MNPSYREVRDEIVYIGNSLHKPAWMDFDKLDFLGVAGSRLYRVNTSESDWDFVGIVVPPAWAVFPHLRGIIPGFGRNIQNFEHLSLQHISSNLFAEVDITVYSIVKFFQLAMNGNPNIVDSLFTMDSETVMNTDIWSYLYDNRHLFLSELCWHRFKGMMYSHLSRLESSHTKEGRKYLEERFGYDVKDAYHALRMVLEITQILERGTIDFEENAPLLIKVRDGEVRKDDVLEAVHSGLNKASIIVENKKAVVPYSPDEWAIKKVLVHCLEMAYGLGLEMFGYNTL